MENNKLVKFSLFLAIIFIWGTLGFKLTQRTDNSSNHFIPVPRSEKSDNSNQLTADSFTLLLNYSDPFLKNLPVKRKKTIASKAKKNPIQKIKKKKVPKQEFTFPPIQYKGSIEAKGGSEVALVNFSGKLLHWKHHEFFKEIKLKEIFQDSIILVKGKHQKTISKEQL